MHEKLDIQMQECKSNFQILKQYAEKLTKRK